MNPISSLGTPGRAEPARDPGAVPTDLAGLFAAIFAATAAAQAAPLPTPVPVLPIDSPTNATPSGEAACVEGGMPSKPAGAMPMGLPNGTPSLPALAALGRPHHDRPGLPTVGVDPTLGDTAPSADVAAPAPTATEAVPSEVATKGAFELPAGMRTVVPTPMPVSPALEAAIAAANAKVSAPTAKPVERVVVTTPSTGGVRDAGVDLTATVARDGLRAVASRSEGARDGGARDAEARTASGSAGKGRARAAGARAEAADATDAIAAAVTPPSEKLTPQAAAHAALAGVTPTHVRPEPTMPTAVGATAGPAPLPDERPQTGSPANATVAFATPDGGEGRLRVSLRGDTLHATLQVPDAAAAERIEQDLGGLSRALRAQGFEEARITVDVARSAQAERGQDEPAPREQRSSREQQSHTHERNARRERGTHREER